MTDDLIDKLPGGVVLMTEAGLITKLNRTAERQLGYGPGELLGQPFSRLLSVAGRLFYQTHFYPLLNLHGRANEVALTFVTRTGERIPVLLNALRQQDADGWCICCVYLPLVQRHHFEVELIQARKVAEQAQIAVQEREAQYRTLASQLEERVQERTAELSQANEQLIYLNTDLKRSNDNLQQFAYVASHDLQEPLRKIQAFGDLIKNQFSEALGEGTDYLDRMQLAASRMSALIRDLLSFSRISTRQEATVPVSLCEVIRTALSNLEVTIGESGAQIQMDNLPTIPGDASQLGQLFQNLLSNALKFRQAGVPPIIQVNAGRVTAVDLPSSVKPTRVAGWYHWISVVDNGIGFDNQYAEQIFQLFQRLHGKSQYDGTGIGLAICQKVAANHGGAITATSQPGQGATFQVYLPADELTKAV